MSYAPGADPLALAAQPDAARISVYAQGADYHDMVKKALKALARWLVERSAGCRAQGVRRHRAGDGKAAGRGGRARLAGQAHQSRQPRARQLAVPRRDLHDARARARSRRDDEPAAPARACHDACPTDAFPAPFRLDARRCISYLTIEHKGPIPEEFREAIGNRIYGCDDCLAVCPWNKFADAARANGPSCRAPSWPRRELADLLALDDAGFRQLFSGSPIKRIGRDRFVRNCLIAAGNSGERGLAAHVAAAGDPDPVVAEAAAWALAKILPRACSGRWRAAQLRDGGVLRGSPLHHQPCGLAVPPD